LKPSKLRLNFEVWCRCTSVYEPGLCRGRVQTQDLTSRGEFVAIKIIDKKKKKNYSLFIYNYKLLYNNNEILNAIFPIILFTIFYPIFFQFFYLSFSLLQKKFVIMPLMKDNFTKSLIIDSYKIILIFYLCEKVKMTYNLRWR
jgi:hypothetical protein